MASVVRFDKWEDSQGNPVLDASDGPINFPSRRNLLYNGAMQVHQRGVSSAGITSTGYYTADRWQTLIVDAGTWTQTVENDGPTGSGLRKSFKVLCTTAKGSLGADDRMAIVQRLEGQDVQVLRKGTASAEKCVLSFWVKSNVTGTYIANVQDATNIRSISAQYSVLASDVWEKKTIVFDGDTTGLLANSNAAALNVFWLLVAGSNRSSGTLQTVWGATTNANLAPGQVNVAGATNNFWQVTGVQLEVGPVATPFEFKPYGQELAECQRYYQRFGGINQFTTLTEYTPAIDTNTVYAVVNLMSPLRSGPTSVEHSGLSLTETLNTLAVSAIVINIGDFQRPVLQITSSGLTQFRPYALSNRASASGYLALSAEL